MANETKHTPGPWRYSGLVGNSPAAIMAGSLQLAHVLVRPKLYDEEITPEQADANARLIATAPELLAASEVIVRACTWLALPTRATREGAAVLDAIDRLRAAIAAAEKEATC